MIKLIFNEQLRESLLLVFGRDNYTLQSAHSFNESTVFHPKQDEIVRLLCTTQNLVRPAKGK